MLEDAEKLRAKLTKAEQALQRATRQMQRYKTELSKVARTIDTRRKILAGSWAFDEAEKDTEFAQRMHRALNRFWLVRDDDRRMFGLPVLTDEQKAAHPNAASIRQGGRKAAPPSPLPDGSGNGPAAPAAPSSEDDTSLGRDAA